MFLTKNKLNKSGKSPWQLTREATGSQIRQQLSLQDSVKRRREQLRAAKWETSHVQSGAWIFERREMVQVIGVYSPLAKWEVSATRDSRRHKGCFSIYLLSYATVPSSVQVSCPKVSSVPYLLAISNKFLSCKIQSSPRGVCEQFSYSLVKQLAFVPQPVFFNRKYDFSTCS